jgi:hypothetical protein
MAKSSRFFSVRLKNGFDEWDYIAPAQTKEHARAYFMTHDINPVSATFLGFSKVNVYPDVYEGPIFYTTINGQTLKYKTADAGYLYLQELFRSQYNDAVDDLSD